MPELGRSCSPGTVLPHRLHGRPCHGAGSVSPMALGQCGPWEPARGLLCLQPLSSSTSEGGHSFGALWVWPHHYGWLLLTPGTGLNLMGREGTLDSLPLTLSQRWPARFQAAPAVPGVGTCLQRGHVFAAGPPWNINAPRPGQRSTAQEFPSRLGLGRPVCFLYNPKARQHSTQIFI